MLLVAILLITLSGCENQKMQNNDNQKDNTTTTDNKEKTNKDIKENDSTTQKDSDSTNTNTNISSPNTVKETSKDQKSFYGSWKITKVAGYAKVSTGEKQSLMGLKISLSNNLATFGNESYNNPQYKMTNKTKANMASEYNTNISKIGIDADSITQLYVSDKMTLFIKDNNTLLYFDEGVFYEVNKAE